MVGYNFNAPAIDFSPLGRLGETYDRSVKRTRDAEVAANRERALASFGQNSDLAALGQTLLRAGDLEGGMQALRLDAAQKGSPFQRERAAAEDARYEQQRADQQAERDRQEANRRETLERADRPQRVTEPGVNEFGDPTRRQGWQYPDGVIKWEDGTETRAAPGPQSGGIGDPNLPDPGSMPAQTMAPPGGNPPDYGYVLPGASGGQYQPMGTVRMPRPDVAPPGQQGRAAVAAPPTPSPSPDVAAQGAQPQQVPLAPPAQAGQAAVAAPAPVQGPPLTATQINQGTSNIAPMTNAEMIAEARRLGIRPGEYRAGREAAIKKEMSAKAEGLNPGQTTDMKNKLAQARKTKEVIDEQLSVLAKDVKEYGSEYVPGTVKARMQTTYTNLLMQLKDMFALGALQAKDMDVIQGMLTDPTAAGYNPFEALYKQFTQRDVTAQQVETIKQIVNNGLHAAEGALGGDPSTVPRMSSPRLEKPLAIGESRPILDGTLERVK